MLPQLRLVVALSLAFMAHYEFPALPLPTAVICRCSCCACSACHAQPWSRAAGGGGVTVDAAAAAAGMGVGSGGDAMLDGKLLLPAVAYNIVVVMLVLMLTC